MEIVKFAQQKGYTILTVERDVDVSGTVPPWKRPNFVNLLKKAVEFKAGTIIFYDLSRLARNVEWGAITLYVLLDYFNVEFVATEFLKHIDNPELRKKTLYDFLWFAELYVEDIRQRTKIGLERAKREGKICHRPSTPIPCDEIKRLRNMGLSLLDIYLLLKEKGYLRYKEKGQMKVISYQWFLRRVHEICRIY